MKITNIENLEEAAAESAQDRRDLGTLRTLLDELLKHEDAMRIPVVVRRLVDAGVDPVVIAKTLIIGDREGSALYQLSARAAALADHERIATGAIAFAARDLDAAIAATMMITGAVWLAAQFSIDRAMLAGLVTGDQPRRPLRADRLGTGALDLVDHDGLGNRAWIVDAIEKAQLPSFAPLELQVRR